MATFNLSRFANIATLKAIKPSLLLEFLEPYNEFLLGQGINLETSSDIADIDYDKLSRVFIAPDQDTPPGLTDSLYLIHEMATDEGMDTLLNEVAAGSLNIASDPNLTPADVAILAWLRNKDILERKHAEQYVTRRRSFEYYQTNASIIPEFKQPSIETLSNLERDLDEWFEEKKRGRGSKVFVYGKNNLICFMIRHGEPLRREGSIVDSGESIGVFYRPEKYDILVYDPVIGELGINAGSKNQKELYLNKIGLHIFGSESFFPDNGKYSLEPLREDIESSLVCSDIDGMDWAILKEIHYHWGGAEREIEIRKANDLFKALKARNRDILTTPKIIKACFQIKFTDSKAPRMITIKPPNLAQYTRDSDSAIIEDWLKRRGFIIDHNTIEDE
jgi:hypothetical protein